MNRVRRPSADRTGYTLVEIMLAFAVIAVLIGVTMPPALRLQADSKLSSAAEQVRSQVAGTRVRAIESGIVYQFRYEPDGRRFISVPYEREIEGSDEDATGTGGTLGVGRLTRFAGELPEGLRFIACCVDPSAGTVKLSADAFGELPNADEMTGVQWSPPILFVPDGAAIDAAFEVADGRKLAIRVQVRGLTGATSVSAMRAESGP
jgi:hypothetical protein